MPCERRRSYPRSRCCSRRGRKDRMRNTVDHARSSADQFRSSHDPPRQTFIESPEPPLAQLAYASGALWNTCIMAGRSEAFWNLGGECCRT